MKRVSKRAVSPVLATLMMVAVAVGLSVIIFTWSQNYLSQTSEAASAQQAAQNIAAQSGIIIEAVTLKPSETGATGNGTAKIYIRNVGSVAILPGQVAVIGRATNAGFNQSIPQLLTWTTNNPTVTYLNSYEISWTPTTALSKGGGAVITVNFAKKGVKDYQLLSGDVITIKVTTTAGTFAQGTYTVP